MSIQQRRTQLMLAGIILLGLLMGLGLFAGKRNRKAASVKHTIKTPAEDVLNYWTEERMRKARPVDLPHLKQPVQEKDSAESDPEQK